MVPQNILMTIYAIRLGIYIARHGQPKTGKENVWSALLSLAINLGLLYWGGFFNIK